MRARDFFPCAFVACAACAGGDVTAPASSAPVALLAQFDSVWVHYDATYPYFDYKHVNWDSLRAVYRPQAAAAASEDDLAGVVRALLGELRDVHAWLTSPGGFPVATYTPDRFVNWRLDVWQSYMRRYGWQPQPTDWGYGYVGNVPYLYFGQWSPARSSSDAVDAILDRFRNAPALIIDVRMNGGGDESLAMAVASRFADSLRLFSYVQYRDGPRHSDLGALQPGILTVRGPWQFSRPVLLLVGRACFSSTEDFVEMMRALPNVTVAGDTTGGGSGNPATFDLGGGWQYSVPRWIEYTAAMQVLEWHGLAPNVVVPASGADFDAARDPVFDYAIGWAARFQVSWRSTVRTADSPSAAACSDRGAATPH